MKNRFFDIAISQASRLAGKKARLISLLAQLGMKLRTVNWRKVDAASAQEKFSVLGRMIRAYATGRYRNIPWKTMVVLIAAVIYFVSPIDLIPDLIPITGLTDDFGVLLWVYNSLRGEVDKFLTWESTQAALQS